MTESPVKGQPGRSPKQNRVATGTLGLPSMQEIFDRNMAIAWEESVLYAPRTIDYVPEGKFLKRLMEENPEFSEEEIQISFQKLNEEAKRIFDENQEMIEADKPVQQETMFWGSMAELNENETVSDREIKVWLLEHPPSQCTRNRPAPKRKLVPKEPERTDLTEEEKAARVTDLIDSVSKGEISQDYTPDSFPTLMELRMISDVVPPKVPKVPKVPNVPKVPKPREQHPLSYSKTNTIPMLLAGAQIGGPQSGPTVAEYLKTGKFAVKKRPDDPNDWVSVLRSGLGSGSAFGSGFGQSSGSGFGSGPNSGSGAASGPTVGQYLNQKLLTEGLIPAFGSGSALGSGSGSGSGLGHQKPAKVMEGGTGPKKGSGSQVAQAPEALDSGSGPSSCSSSGTEVGQSEKPQDPQEDQEEQAREAADSSPALGSSGSASGCSGLTPPAHTKDPEEDPNQDDASQEDHTPQPSDSDSRHQDSENNLEEDRDTLETSTSGPQDDSQAQEDQVTQEDLDALRLAAGYHDLGPQYDDDGAQNYFYPEDDFFEDQGDSEPQDEQGPQALEDENPEKELDSSGSGPQDGSEAVDGFEDLEASGLGQVPDEDQDHGEILGAQEEAGADSELEPEDSDDYRQENRIDTSGSGSRDDFQAQEDQAPDALGSGHMPVEDHEMNSGSDLNEDPEGNAELLEDAQRAQSHETSGSGTEDLGSGTEDPQGLLADTQTPRGTEDLVSRTATSGSGTEALSSGTVPEMAAEHQNSPTQEDEDLDPEDQEEDQEQEALGPGSGYQDLGPQKPQIEPEEDSGCLGPQEDQEASGPKLQIPDHGLDSGRQDPEDQYENDEDDDFGLEDLDEEDSGRWGDEEEDSVYRDQEDQDPEPFGLVSGHQGSGHQSPQDYYEAQGNEDDELKDQIELQEVQEPKLPGSSVGRQDLKPQRPHIELQEYQDPNFSEPEPMNPTGPLLHWRENVNFGAQKRHRTPEPEVEPQPKRFSPERGHYSGIPVWEMYQRAKKMFEDLAKKEALRSSGQLQENSEDDEEASFGSESPRASPSSSAAPIPTAHEQECHEDDDEDSFGSESPQSTRDSASSSAAPIPTACMQVNSEEDVGEFSDSDSPLTSRTSTPVPTAPIPTDHYNDLLETPEPIVFAQREKTPEQPALVHQHIKEYNEEFFENESSQSTRDSASSSATPIPTGSESPNAEEPLIYDHDYLHKVEYEIAAMQANDIIYDDVYEDDQGSHSPRNSSPIPTAPTPEALEPEIYDADDDGEFWDNGIPQRSNGSSRIPAESSPAYEQVNDEKEFSGNWSPNTSRASTPVTAAPSPALEEQHIEEYNEKFSGSGSRHTSRDSSPISEISSPAHEQANNEDDDEELLGNGSPQMSRGSSSSSEAHEQENNEDENGESFARKSLKRSRDSTPRPVTPIPKDLHNHPLETPEPIVIAQREKTPEPPVGIPPGYEELLLNYSPFRATLKLIERQLRLPLTAEELRELLENARRNSMNQSSQEPKRKRCRFF